MKQIPVEVKRLSSDGLSIKWSNGANHTISSKTLRLNCPCATCRQKRGDDSHALPLTGRKKGFKIIQSSLSEELGLTEVWAVGQYAIGMAWGDGHNTGIYSYGLLYELGRNEMGEGK